MGKEPEFPFKSETPFMAGERGVVEKTLCALPILLDNLQGTFKVAGGGGTLCTSVGEQPSMWGAVADLCVHLPPLWESPVLGSPVVLCMLVRVTLNLILHISVSHLRICVLGRVCEGGSVFEVGRGDSHTFLKFSDSWNWEKHKPPPPNYFTEASLPRCMLPSPTSQLVKGLIFPTFSSSFLCTITSPEVVSSGRLRGQDRGQIQALSKQIAR